MKQFSLFIFLFLIPCTKVQSIETINSSPDNTSSINMYSEYHNEYGYLAVTNPIFIIDSQLLYFNTNSSDVINFVKIIESANVLKNRTLNHSKVKIENDIINFYLPEVFFKRSMRMYSEMVNYTGILSANKDTIFDFHMIPPYPKINMKYNDGVIESYAKKRMYIKYPLSDSEKTQLINLFKSKGIIKTLP